MEEVREEEEQSGPGDRGATLTEPGGSPQSGGPGGPGGPCVLCGSVLKAQVSSCGHALCGQCSDQETLPCPQCGKRPKVDYTAPRDYRSSLVQSCQSVSDGADALKQISTELYITEGLRSEVSVQHEETQMETRSKTVPDAHISCRDIFKAPDEQHSSIRAVLTVGVAGAGKTSSVLKFCVDWAQGSENQELQLVVPLSFRELHLVSRGRYSLMELIRVFHPALRPLSPHALSRGNVLFICDGLDESRLTLDFSCELISEVTQRSEVSVLLVNLIRGDLLPDALIWITSRPAAANQIPARCVHRVTEVRGFFTESQKENFFRSRFSDEERLQTVLSHLRTSRSLHTMSQIPVFCCITATVLEHVLRTPQSGPLPQTLTDLYAHFLLLQTNRKRKDREEKKALELTSADCELLLKLGRLAFEQLLKGNLTFYQEDLQQVGLDLSQASGLCSEIFRRESVLFNKSIYCFVHLSVQEFLAAVHVLHCFNTKNNKELKRFVQGLGPNSTVDVFLKKALQKALSSPSGHLDLLVRFLHGLTLENNQRLLGDLLGPSQTDSETRQTLINNLKKMKTKASPDRSINMFHCLTELHDHSLHQQIQKFLKSLKKDGGKKRRLSAIQASALVHRLQTSEEVLEELDLNSYNATAEGLLRLVPAVRNCRAVDFYNCELLKVHVGIVASALSTSPSLLRVLDLSCNPGVSSSIQLLCEGLQSPNCRLENLRLWNCELTASSCLPLASALKAHPSHLRVLDLEGNYVKDQGVEHLCGYLQSPDCRLEKIKLWKCGLTESSCSFLVSALRSNPSYLRVLDLGFNSELGDSGVDTLCGFLRSSDCRLETLILYWCGLTESSCSYLASALKANPSRLKELNVGYNKDLKDPGVERLCEALQSPDCGLETLGLYECGVTPSGVSSLVSALRSNPSHLRVLNLCRNVLTEEEVQELLRLQQSPDCRLEKVIPWTHRT